MRRFQQFLILGFIFFTNFAIGQEMLRPFQTHNQSPLAHFFAIPTNPGGSILKKNAFFFENNLNIANNATSDEINNEAIYLDGEMYRNEISLSYGLFSKLEIGITVPLIKHSSGIMDSFISGWHDVFNLPEKSRAVMPSYDLNYIFMEDDELIFKMDESRLSMGDISFLLGTQLYNGLKHKLAFRSFLKLPTGNRKTLIGSGTCDFGFQVTGSLNSFPRRKQVSLFYSGGYLRIGNGALLSNKITRNVAFSNFGLAYNFNNKWYLKSQVDFHTGLYRKSDTDQLGKSAAQFVIGLEYFVQKNLGISLGFAEDIIVNTSPDFVLQLGVSHTF